MSLLRRHPRRRIYNDAFFAIFLFVPLGLELDWRCARRSFHSRHFPYTTAMGHERLDHSSQPSPAGSAHRRLYSFSRCPRPQRGDVMESSPESSSPVTGSQSDTFMSWLAVTQPFGLLLHRPLLHRRPLALAFTLALALSLSFSLSPLALVPSQFSVHTLCVASTSSCCASTRGHNLILSGFVSISAHFIGFVLMGKRRQQWYEKRPRPGRRIETKLGSRIHPPVRP